MQNMCEILCESEFEEYALNLLEIVFHDSIEFDLQLLMIERISIILPEIDTKNIHISFKGWDKIETKVMLMGVAVKGRVSRGLRESM